ncbi:MAG: hypothetical protein RLZZ444_3183 [Pseudomonadota bacterium]|jgi:hypothetical protein
MDSHDQEDFALRSGREHAAKIRELNDHLRVRHAGGQLFVTHGICSLGDSYVPAIIKAVTDFEGFDDGNDPYGEHDFGALQVLGHRIFWKIDHYDEQMQYASPDPADPAVTIRVLTIMLASEY